MTAGFSSLSLVNKQTNHCGCRDNHNIFYILIYYTTNTVTLQQTTVFHIRMDGIGLADSFVCT